VPPVSGNGRRATVIGAAEFVGRSLLARLRSDGWDACDATNDPLSVCDQPLGHVFYCPAVAIESQQRQHEMLQSRVSLLGLLLQHGQYESLVYLSSTRLYDGVLADTASEDTPLALDPAHPRHLHGLSLALGEALCRHATSGRARVARLGCVYRDATDADGFVARLMRDVAGISFGQPARLHVPTTAQRARDYVHLDDALQALLLIATGGTQPLYNVASGVNVSNRELFARLQALSGCEIVAGQRHIVRPTPRIDTTRMRQEFGWQPRRLLDNLAELLPQPALC
jgi:nucleoside-diphosphate-sugar epimerase